ncbi:hypothetical protein VSS37_03675, partial [Candidatus Thiothrix sp. Deng01]
MNGLALGGFANGQRLALQDLLTMNREQRAQQDQDYEMRRREALLPLDITGKGLANRQLALQNDRYSQETPLSVAGLG